LVGGPVTSVETVGVAPAVGSAVRIGTILIGLRVGSVLGFRVGSWVGGKVVGSGVTGAGVVGLGVGGGVGANVIGSSEGLGVGESEMGAVGYKVGNKVGYFVEGAIVSDVAGVSGRDGFAVGLVVVA